ADPSPLDYLAYRAYLNDWFESRNLRPSMRKFARDVGVSRQLVSSVCAGQRNLGERRAPTWADRLGLQDLQRSYFLALVRSEEGATPQLRKEAFGSVQAMRAYRETRSDRVLIGLSAHWLRPVIHEMARWPDFVPEVAWIAPRIGPRATIGEIEAALKWLSETGLLGPEGEEALHAALASAQEAPPGALTQALGHHHFELLDIAQRQLPDVPPKKRTYLNITAALTEDQLQRFQEELKDFQRRMHAIASEPPTGTVDRVYALSIQLFPLALVPDAADVPEPPEGDHP
ncbi:MAG: DUF4423 domain-containing protein, partial [Myxococcota bacterium]